MTGGKTIVTLSAATTSATCCNDHVHCCPQNIQCDLVHGTCVSKDKVVPMSKKVPARMKLQTSATVKCDDTTTCPGSTTCCCLTSGNWGCCPYEDVCEYLFTFIFQGVCCPDRVHCCPYGHVCLNYGAQCSRSGSPLWELGWLKKKQPAL
ncbi:progranulin-like [Aquarana catesbeiana]|uniref:progranulin-like n=1 Tax=Aquarana catesbeiana TaxID=8400 RepID=UPI003CCA3FB4